VWVGLIAVIAAVLGLGWVVYTANTSPGDGDGNRPWDEQAAVEVEIECGIDSKYLEVVPTEDQNLDYGMTYNVTSTDPAQPGWTEIDVPYGVVSCPTPMGPG
jgi:hypothetical protein